MAAKTWIKWLSVTALALCLLSIVLDFGSMVNGRVIWASSTDIVVLLLSIVAVMGAFSKKK